MSDSDSSDEEARAEVRARLAARLGQTPKADAWAELEQRLKSRVWWMRQAVGSYTCATTFHTGISTSDIALLLDAGRLVVG